VVAERLPAVGYRKLRTVNGCPRSLNGCLRSLNGCPRKLPEDLER